MTKEKLDAIIKDLKGVKDRVDKYCKHISCDDCIFNDGDNSECYGVKLDDSFRLLCNEREKITIKEMVNDAIRKAKENARKS